MRNLFTFKACIGEPSNVYFQQSYNNDNNGWIVFKFDELFAMDSKNKYPKLDYVKDAKLYVCLAGISDFANVSGVYDYEDIENENNIENVLEIIEDIVKNDRPEFIFENYKADGMGIYDVKLSDIKDKYKLLCVVDVKGSQIYVNLDDGVRSDRGDSMFSSWYSGLLNSFFEVEIDVNKIGNDEDIYESRKLRRNKMKKVYESRNIRKPLRKINEKKVMKEEHRLMSGREILDILSDYIINAYSDELIKVDDWSDVLDVVNAEIKEWKSPLASIIYKKLNIADKNMEECNDSKKLVKEDKENWKKYSKFIYDVIEYPDDDFTETVGEIVDRIVSDIDENTTPEEIDELIENEVYEDTQLDRKTVWKIIQNYGDPFKIVDKYFGTFYNNISDIVHNYLKANKEIEECNDSKKLKESIKKSIQKRMMKESEGRNCDAYSIAGDIMDDLERQYGEGFIDEDLDRRVGETLDNYFIYDKDIREMINTYARNEYNDGSYTIKELTNIAYENAYGEVLSRVERMVEDHNDEVEENEEELDEKCGKKVKKESRFNRKIAKH